MNYLSIHTLFTMDPKNGATKTRRRRGKIVFCLLVAVFSMMLLTACSNQTGMGVTEDTGSDTENAGNVTEDTGNIIVDQLGRTVELPEKIEKVSATHIYGYKMLFAMGQMEKLGFQSAVGGADTEALAEVDDFYASLPIINPTPHVPDNPEDLINQGVNVIFTNVSKGAEETELFQNAGITAIAVSGETFEEVYETARIMGKVFDCPERSDEVISFIEDLRALVSERTAKIPEDQKPTVLVCGSGGVYTAATKDMFQHQMVETAGGINAGAGLNGHWASISAEDIISSDPDYIFLGSSKGVDDVKSVLADPALQTVKAVKNKEIYIFPSSLGWWDFPLPQSVLGIIWTGKTIHPELYEDIDMLKVADSVYEFMFGYSYTELGGVL
ncbi:MAG: ABC transporter substrate-binding protein [Dethiobacteria bacterium]|jgi:iron complex transport system substrate-binding protein